MFYSVTGWSTCNIIYESCKLKNHNFFYLKNKNLSYTHQKVNLNFISNLSQIYHKNFAPLGAPADIIHPDSAEEHFFKKNIESKNNRPLNNQDFEDIKFIINEKNRIESRPHLKEALSKILNQSNNSSIEMRLRTLEKIVYEKILKDNSSND